MKRFWIGFGVLALVGFVVLGWLGWRTFDEMPQASGKVILHYIRLVYGAYLFVVCLFLTWFIWKVKQPMVSVPAEKTTGMDKREVLFFSVLIIAIISLHALTLSNFVPWQKWRLWSRPELTDSFSIGMADYSFKFPSQPVVLHKGRFVEFILTSEDVTYGFGVFRKDGSLVFQMQVLPGYKNRYVWNFSEVGSYDIRSTEYSGPRHSEMFVKDAITVID